MTSRDFVIWLKGFSKAANSYNVTPRQWEDIMYELDKVQDVYYEEEPNEALLAAAEKYKILLKD